MSEGIDIRINIDISASAGMRVVALCGTSRLGYDSRGVIMCNLLNRLRFEYLTANGTLFVLGAGFGAGCFGIRYPVARSVSEGVYFFICCIITTRTCIVCVPADFGTRWRFCRMRGNIVSERFAVFFSANRANRLLGASRFSACMTEGGNFFRIEDFATI